jgi:hypothetical protein
MERMIYRDKVYEIEEHNEATFIREIDDPVLVEAVNKVKVKKPKPQTSTGKRRGRPPKNPPTQEPKSVME